MQILHNDLNHFETHKRGSHNHVVTGGMLVSYKKFHKLMDSEINIVIHSMETPVGSERELRPVMKTPVGGGR